MFGTHECIQLSASQHIQSAVYMVWTAAEEMYPQAIAADTATLSSFHLQSWSFS